MKSVDINCDMGESFGAYVMGNDEAVLALISSANIACGFHAGDSATMRQTVNAAARAGVAVGAHPGLPDLQGFGRRAMQMTPDEVYEICLHQIGALAGFCKAAGVELEHVKPHGALSHMASADPEIAGAIVQATRDFDPRLLFFSPIGSHLGPQAERAGLSVVHEVYADRTYLDSGLLTPRSHPRALITEVGEAVAQVLDMVLHGFVTSITGKRVEVVADSICVHGDGAHALSFAASLKQRLEAEGLQIRSPRKAKEKQ